MRTIHTAPDAIFVAISADFEDVMMMGDGEALIEEIRTTGVQADVAETPREIRVARS